MARARSFAVAMVALLLGAGCQTSEPPATGAATGGLMDLLMGGGLIGAAVAPADRAAVQAVELSSDLATNLDGRMAWLPGCDWAVAEDTRPTEQFPYTRRVLRASWELPRECQRPKTSAQIGGNAVTGFRGLDLDRNMLFPTEAPPERRPERVDALIAEYLEWLNSPAVKPGVCAELATVSDDASAIAVVLLAFPDPPTAIPRIVAAVSIMISRAKVAGWCAADG